MFLVREPMKFLTSRVAISHLGRESQKDTLYSRCSRKKPKKSFTDSVVFLFFFLEYREYKMFIVGICFILYFLKRKPSVAGVGCTKDGWRDPPDSDFSTTAERHKKQ